MLVKITTCKDKAQGAWRYTLTNADTLLSVNYSNMTYKTRKDAEVAAQQDAQSKGWTVVQGEN